MLIEDYVTQVALAIEYVTAYPTSSALDGGLTNQAKLDVLHDTRQAFGRSALVLQGGSVFGLCHIGVVKALHLRGLLPRIIAGTATGALIAALVGVHTEDELLEVLTGEAIDFSAFQKDKDSLESQGTNTSLKENGWLATLLRRTQRLFRDGYFLDISVLERCVRANVGDLTFEEAYTKTKRVLNITISTASNSGIPSLLNYLTAPNVVCTMEKPALRNLTDSLDYLVRCTSIECDLHASIRSSHPPLQRSFRRHRSMEHHSLRHLPTRISCH